MRKLELDIQKYNTIDKILQELEKQGFNINKGMMMIYQVNYLVCYQMEV